MAEWTSVAAITRDVWSLTSELGCPTVPQASLLRAVYVLRLIQKMYGLVPRPRVFEIGPGTGYLGALLAIFNYPFTAMDITQGFYLYQYTSWGRVAPKGITELAAEETFCPQRFADPSGGRPIHLPWWNFATLHPGDVPAYDLVICNRALCEMHPTALDFSLRIARSLLSGNGCQPKAFLFDGWGADIVSKPIHVVRAFLRAGFAPVFLDRTCTTGVFIPWRLGEPFSRDCHSTALFEIQYATEHHALTTIRHVFDNSVPNAVAQSLQNQGWSSEVLPVGESRIEELWDTLLGSVEHRTHDERFWDDARLPAFVLESLPEARNVYLFGAGAFGRNICRTLRQLRRPPKGFVDNDASKWGTLLDGLRIHNPSNIPTGALVLITTAYWREIRSQLLAMGLAEGGDFFVFPDVLA